MPDFLISGDSRVMIRRQVIIAGEGVTLTCGYLSISAVIRAAAYRGAVSIRDRRQTNF